MSEIVFKKYKQVVKKFLEIDDNYKGDKQVICKFCTSEHFTIVKKGNSECLECRCGNKIFPDDIGFAKKPQIEKYQSLLESIDGLKDEFLFNIRTENRNTNKERVGVFVDIQNVYYGARDNFKGKVDYKVLLENILKGRKLIVANAYVINNSAIDNKNFVSLLQKLGYTIKDKDLRVRGDGSQKGNVDIEMAIDIMNKKDVLDTVALVSGDGDFVPLVEFLKNINIKVEVFSFSANKNSTAYDLKETASKFFEIDKSYLFQEKESE